MTLSEAIRLGAMLKPQGFGNYHSKDGTCALGAARDAGYDIFTDEVRYYDNAPCPVCQVRVSVPTDSRESAELNTLPHLNDHHRWTREQIADWIDAVDAERQPALTVRTDDVRGTETVGVGCLSTRA